MVRDSQQSIEKSQSLITKARVATAGLTLLTMVAAEKVMSSAYSESPKNPEVSTLVSNLDNLIGFSPREAVAGVLECITRITALKIHAPAEDPSRSITGVRVQMWNETNPGARLTFVADSDQAYSSDKSRYKGNSSVVGGGESLLKGNATGERDCDNPDQSKCATTQNGRKIKTTSLVGMQVDEDGSPVTGKVARVQADCPSKIICDWDGAWNDERPAKPVVTLEPAPPKPEEKCPEGTTQVSNSPMICERRVEVPIPVESPGQAPR